MGIELISQKSERKKRKYVQKKKLIQSPCENETVFVGHI